MELYCDHHGNRIHLLCSSVMTTKKQAELNADILIWTGADGRRSKVNLDVKVREAVYKEVDKKWYTLHLDEEKLEKCRKILRKCFETGKFMNANNISIFVKRESATARKGQTSRRKYTAEPFTCFLKTPGRFSSSIIIPILIQSNQVQNDMCFVFVDCSSLETFLEPKVCIKSYRNFYTGDPYWDSSTPVTSMLSLPHADLVPLAVSSSEVIYYDKYGEEFDRVFMSDVKLECGPPQVYRNLVYYVDQENSLVQGLNGNRTVLEHFAFVNKMAVCRNVIIMMNLESLIFADAISLLPLEVLLSDKITPSLPNGVDKERVTYFKVIGEKEIVKDTGIKYNLVAIAIDSHLVVVEIPLCEEPEFVEITMCVEVCGLAKDICFISPYCGVLVSVASHSFPRETLHHFDSRGRLQGLLPGLGKGPRSFLPLMLPIKTDGAESDRKAWHIYMRDGHDGILCVILE
ncbi:uncharacterized protein LOC117327011 [Pecten maximus]|uniref:uncharacterized protein LOC117327011 n=1 Tax=Pecten maximus TaxID=6579 RepID=UPI0014585B3B|nr:uncharacterized protein LOC117327011 [Pecten maximus]